MSRYRSRSLASTRMIRTKTQSFVSAFCARWQTKSACSLSRALGRQNTFHRMLLRMENEKSPARRTGERGRSAPYSCIPNSGTSACRGGCGGENCCIDSGKRFWMGVLLSVLLFD